MFKHAAIVSLLALPVLPALGAEPVMLQYKYDTDEPVRAEIVQNVEQAQTMMGKKRSSTSKMTTRVVTELLEEKEDGSLLLSHKTDRVLMDLSASGVEIEYDSSLAEDRPLMSNPAIASAAALVGWEVKLLIRPDGTVEEIANLDQLKQTTATLPEEADAQAVQAMLQEDSLKSFHQTYLRLLPEEPVEPGDTWERAFSVPFSGGEMSMNLGLTLDKVEDGKAYITVGGDVTMDDVVQQGATLSLKSGALDGAMVFNIEQGVQELYELEMDVSIGATAEGFPGEVFTADLTQNTRMQRLDF